MNVRKDEEYRLVIHQERERERACESIYPSLCVSLHALRFDDDHENSTMLYFIAFNTLMTSRFHLAVN